MENVTPTATRESEESDDRPPVRQLTRQQRRVLGVLIEKAFTTSESYPLTLKSAATGCNQKSNRNPVTQYSEDSVEETMDDLRQLGLVAVVHTESGRTERYRHFMRQRFPFSETQLAIITELLLRGRQQLGELRSRASRMVSIDSLDQLRSDLQELASQGYVQASGPLERRGIEVDHKFYEPEEAQKLDAITSPVAAAPAAIQAPASPTNDEPRTVETVAADDGRLSALKHECMQLRDELSETRQDVETLKEQLTQLSDELSDLRRDLGA